jgi:hypothetical protein
MRVLLLASLSLFAAAAAAFPSEPYYPLHDGATWTYSSPQSGTWTETVVGSGTFNGSTVKIVRDEAGNESYYTNDLQGVRLHGRYFPDAAGNETDTYLPPVALAAVDAAIGVAVNGTGTVSVLVGMAGFSVSYSSTSVPVGYENVSVPAGTFANALRVQLTVNYAFDSVAWYQTADVWLVLGIGIVKQVLYDSSDGSTLTQELVSHTVPDTVPDPFSFAPKTVPGYLLATSDPITVTGIDAPAPIRAPGGYYSINGGPLATTPGTVNNNDQVTVSFHAPAPGGSASITLNIGGVAADFTVTTIADSTPNPFGLLSADGVPPGVAISSNILIVSGTDAAAPISISGGEYSIESEPYTSAAGSVLPGRYVRVRVVSSTTPGATASATLTIGGVSGSFSVTTLRPDEGPRTVLYFESQPGDGIGRGDRRIFNVPQVPLPGASTTLTPARNFDNSVRFWMNQSITDSTSGSDWFFLNLEAPGGGLPLPGRHEGARRYPFNDAAAGLDFSGNGSGCDTLTGRFDVLEAVYAENGDVVRFAANFRQTCEFATGSLLGQIRYNSRVPLGADAIVGRKADFGGDGRSDILWRNISSGENYAYFMTGVSIVNEGYLRTVADQDWQVAAVGDFNGDSKADVLWRNSSSGENYVYFMHGTNIVAEGYLRTVADQRWQVGGAGDFDGDGRDDILWRNAATGENYVYLMNGTGIAGEGYLRTVADPGWQIAGTGDFDGNGRADILWRHASSGENYVYFMQGTNIAGEGYLRTVADPAWQIKALGDFNGDGRTDIAWRHASSGENYLYLMHGTSIAGEGYVRTVADLAWRIVGSGDYDGDGRSDLLWRKAATGENYLYPMDGLSIKSSEGYVRSVPPGAWTIVGK